MIIENRLSLFLDCMKSWEERPSRDEFNRQYLEPMISLLSPMLEDWDLRHESGIYDVVEELKWKEYREITRGLSPQKEEKRLQACIQGVETLLGVKLEGEAVLFSAFTMMDGYARFDRGKHRVFLGVDESHDKGEYLNILMTHELTHVARESLPSTWGGYGLTEQMTHDEFTQNLPVAEHLFNEGFSCVISELLVKSKEPWHYAYQDRPSMAFALKNAGRIDQVIHQALTDPDADYGHLYNPSLYGRGQAMFCHYVWAWQWVKELLKTQTGGDPSQLLKRCSKDFIEHGKNFRLADVQEIARL